MPYPDSFPTYTTTLILMTVFSRLVQVPFAYKGRQRYERAQALVQSDLAAMRPTISQHVMKEMKLAGVKADMETLKNMHKKRQAELLNDYRKDLMKKHNAGTLKNLILPNIVQVPIFLGLTLFAWRLCTDPTPLEAESFLWIDSLIRPDPTMTVPVGLGVLTFAMAETKSWTMTAAERAAQDRARTQRRLRAAAGKMEFNLAESMKSAIRLISLPRIVVTSFAPAGLGIVWLTNSLFGLIQNVSFDMISRRRRAREEVDKPKLQPATAPPPPPESPLAAHIRKISDASSELSGDVAPSGRATRPAATSATPMKTASATASSTSKARAKSAKRRQA